MNKKRISKLAVMLLSLILILGMSASVTIAYLQASAEPVTNTFKPVQTAEDDLDIDVEGTKKLVGRAWKENDNFAFLLEKKNGDEWDVITGGAAYATGNNGSGDSRTFDYSAIIEENLTEGTNEFRISELDTDITGITYDSSVAQFKVDVMKVATTGALLVTEVANTDKTDVTEGADGKYTVAFEFVNKYTSPSPVDVTVYVDKEVKNIGDKTIGLEGFTFKLEDGDLTAAKTDVSDENGNASFKLEYDADDIGETYNYELSEVNDGKEFVTYDSTVYDVQVSLDVNRDNKIVPVVSINGEVSSNKTAKFVNEYDYEEESTKPGDGPTDPTDDSKKEPTDSTDKEQSTSDKSDKDDGSKTGDDFNMILPITLLITSGLIMAIILIDRRRRRA